MLSLFLIIMLLYSLAQCLRNILVSVALMPCYLNAGYDTILLEHQDLRLLREQGRNSYLPGRLPQLSSLPNFM